MVGRHVVADMPIVTRWSLTLILEAIVAFCGFGFLATFEPPGFVAWRLMYGTVALVCVVTIVAVWLVRS